MPTSGPRTNTRKRAADAYQLRCQGRTYDNIATELQYGSAAAAHKAVVGHIRRMPPEETEMARALSAGTYSAVIAGLHDLAKRCKALERTTAEQQAWEAIASTTERRDKLLGLHIAVASKLDVNVHHNATELIESTREQMRAIAQQQSAIPAPQPQTQPALTVIEGEVLP